MRNPRKKLSLNLTAEERRRLEEIAGSTLESEKRRMRARILLAYFAGQTPGSIAEWSRVSVWTVRRRVRQAVKGGALDALNDKRPGPVSSTKREPSPDSSDEGGGGGSRGAGDPRSREEAPSPPLGREILLQMASLLRGAVERTPDNPNAHYFLGIVRLKLGVLEAEEWYRRASALDPETPLKAPWISVRYQEMEGFWDPPLDSDDQESADESSGAGS